MSSLALSLVVLAHFVVGMAALSLWREDVLASTSRLGRIALAMLLGICIPAMMNLLATFAGAQISNKMLGGLSLISVLVLIARWRTAFRGLRASTEPASTRRDGIGLVIMVGIASLVLWVCCAAAFLPVHDYDGLVIWSYRLKVLLAERTIYTDSLRDPLRVVPQPLHPYFIPMVQMPYLLALGQFSYRAIQIPNLLIYGAYAGLVLSIARSMTSWRSRIFVSAAGLMPILALGMSEISSREPIMGIWGFASVLLLAQYSDSRRIEHLVTSAFFALCMQQSKIEGYPFAIGWVAALALIVVAQRGNGSLLLRHAACAVAVLSLAIPWALVRRSIPVAHADPVLSNYSIAALLELHNALRVMKLVAFELLFRPELYGFATYAIIICAFSGWSRGNAVKRIALLLPPLMCLAAICAIYAVRQADLPFERNMSISRRLMCVMPALVFAAAWLPRPQQNELTASGTASMRAR